MEIINKPQKVVEIYMNALKEYQHKLKKEKLTVLMQVGDFFEIYGLIYPDGHREGNIWEFCDNTNLKIGPKPMVVFNNPAIEVVMGGVQPAYANTYIQKAVDKYGWTVVIFEQERIGNSSKFERKETAIISPGININSENFSNITMVIYMEGVKNYIGVTSGTFSRDTVMVNIGMAFVDCLSGENGLMAINNTPLGEMSIALDELLKLLTIKNPNELVIHIENVDITDSELINALHLYNHQFKINRLTLELEKFTNLRFQQTLLDTVYIKHRGTNNIMQQLDIDDEAFYFTRVALCTLIEHIQQHDKTIIEKLERPEIILNSDKYLMLANNCLEQLDIIDNLKSTTNINPQYGIGTRKSLLELLDNTKTPIGRIKLRQRLSIPITSPEILTQRYATIEEMLVHHSTFKSKNRNDKFGSPLYQIRNILANIRNIDNYLRKIIVGKLVPCEMVTYIDSLEKCHQSIKYIFDEFKGNSSIIAQLLPSDANIDLLGKLAGKLKGDLLTENCKMLWTDIENNIFKKGVSQTLDDLQAEIEFDRNFVTNLMEILTQISNEEIGDPKKATGQINTGDNATHGIHLYTTNARKESLEKNFAKDGRTAIKIDKYSFEKREIKFHKMKESKWMIEVPYLKVNSGSLKSNLDRLVKLVKVEFQKWCCAEITAKNDVLTMLGKISTFIAEIDIIQSNALNAIENGYTKPVIALKEHSYLDAKAIRHPIIEQINTTTKYVPNDVKVGCDGVNGILLFGVNAVGKSSLMKSLGINVIMAQAGMYVAASEFVFHPYKYLFTRIRSNDNLYAGLSSFEVEMKEFKVILKYADSDSIILGDEIAKGTVIEDATALVAAGIIQLSKRNANFMFATHMHSLTNLDCIKQLRNIKMCHLLIERDPQNPRKLVYSRKLKDGSGPSSYGILVCDSMGMDNEFLNKAKEIRQMIEGGSVVCVGDSGVSKYNREKVVCRCEICGEQASDVHHINQQCDANESELIETVDAGIFNKNKLWNLVALCKSCHIDVHSVPSRLCIDGYVGTNMGIELKWSRALKVNDTGICIEKTVEESSSKVESTNNYKEMHTNDKKTNDKTDLKGLPDDVTLFIRNMKENGATPKKIQFDLKRKYNIEMKQQEIRGF